MPEHNSAETLAKIPDDEPYFVLRAQDATAPRIIREWIEQNKYTAPGHKIDSARTVVFLMEYWQQQHAEYVKMAD